MSETSAVSCRPLVLPASSPIARDWEAEEADSFGAVADEVFAPIYPCLVADLISAWGRPLTGLTVLEVGGGVGNMALELLKAGVGRLDDLDVSQAMLARAVARLASFPGLARRFRPLAGDVCTLALPAAAYDLVFSRGSIQFWADIPRALANLRQALRPQGLAYLGGGFGLNTPPAVKQAIQREKERRLAQMPNPRPIPQLDKMALLEVAQQLGGQARLELDGPGFWLIWHPHRASTA